MREHLSILLAEQSLEVQLQAADGGVERVQLPALLPGAARSLGARRPQVGLEMPVEVVAALHLVQAAVQGVPQGLGHRDDGAMQQQRRRSSGGLPLLQLLNPPGRQEEGQSTEALGTLSHPQLEEHLQTPSMSVSWRLFSQVTYRTYEN